MGVACSHGVVELVEKVPVCSPRGIRYYCHKKAGETETPHEFVSTHQRPEDRLTEEVVLWQGSASPTPRPPGISAKKSHLSEADGEELAAAVAEHMKSVMNDFVDSSIKAGSDSVELDVQGLAAVKDTSGDNIGSDKQVCATREYGEMVPQSKIAPDVMTIDLEKPPSSLVASENVQRDQSGPVEAPEIPGGEVPGVPSAVVASKVATPSPRQPHQTSEGAAQKKRPIAAGNLQQDGTSAKANPRPSTLKAGIANGTATAAESGATVTASSVVAKTGVPAKSSVAARKDQAASSVAAGNREAAAASVTTEAIESKATTESTEELPAAGPARQRKFGPQSKRGAAPQFQLSTLDANPHAIACFDALAFHEEELCGEWAAFYHSYSTSALLYEVQASIAAVLFGFAARQSVLPRLLFSDFREIPDARTLMALYKSKFGVDTLKDHHPDFRKVAISAMCSLVSLGPEASPPVCFIAGYSHSDDPVSFRQHLESLLWSLVPSTASNKQEVKKLVTDVISLAEEHHLDVSAFGGKPCPGKKAGHILQIFVRRSLVEELAYAAIPWGDVDVEREPIATWLDDNSNTSWGQARIVAHPKYFLDVGQVQMHVASADPDFHSRRARFQMELTERIAKWLSEPEMKRSALHAIREGPSKDKANEHKKSKSSWLGRLSGKGKPSGLGARGRAPSAPAGRAAAPTSNVASARSSYPSVSGGASRVVAPAMSGAAGAVGVKKDVLAMAAGAKSKNHQDTLV